MMMPRAVLMMMPRAVLTMMPRAVLMMVVRLDDDAASLAHPFTLVFAVMPLVSDSYGMCVLIHGVFVPIYAAGVAQLARAMWRDTLMYPRSNG
jgi:hypothetical protein